MWQIAKFYTKAFLRDTQELNIRKPGHIAPATKFIPEQIALIEQLFRHGYAYETSKAVYFDVSKFKNYTKLSRQKLSEKVEGARDEAVADPEKRHPYDFVLWFKLVGRFKNHIMRWLSPWGAGFPGWHIECSAISTAFLGQPFDIHTGGIDHIPIHHTNEIAQSEGAYSKPLTKYWMHSEFLVINKKRMGKSGGGFITLSDVKKKGFLPLSYRYFVLGAHYRKKLNFTWEGLGAAGNALEKLYRDVGILASLSSKLSNSVPKEKTFQKEYLRRFTGALNDDLNTPKALAILWDVLKNPTLSPHTKLTLLFTYDNVLSLNLKNAAKHAKIPASVAALLKERELCRTRKQFMQADALRKKIQALGWSVEDMPEGPRARKLN